MSNYLHALRREEVQLETGDEHYTDTGIIHVSERISTFSRKSGNFLLYKVMVTHKFTQIIPGTHQWDLGKIVPATKDLISRFGRAPERENTADLSLFFQFFPDPLLAEDVLNFLESVRACLKIISSRG